MSIVPKHRFWGMVLVNVFIIFISPIPTAGEHAAHTAQISNRPNAMFMIRGVEFCLPLKHITIAEFLDKSIGHTPEHLIKDGLPHYGARRDDWLGKTRKHKGFDVYVDNTNVIAAASGKVTAVGNGSRSGLYVKLEHDNGMETLYIHLTKVHVSRGQRVAGGDTIGRIDGATGNAHSPQLHFEVHIDHKSIDPLLLIEDYHSGNRLVADRIERFRSQLPRKVAHRDKLVKVYVAFHSKPSKQTSNGRYRYHRVKRGDTLSSIAIKYRTTVKDIMALNHLKNPHNIREASKLKIPKAR